MIYIKITAMSNMNVYLYSGSNRDEMTKSVVPNNIMPAIDETYMVDATEGHKLMVVAFPEMNMETDF